MNTIHDLEATSYAPTSQAPHGEECTVASAWSSSPLGNPANDGAVYSDAAGYADNSDGFATELIAPTRKPWFMSKGVLAGTLIAAVGLSAGLGITLLGNSNQTHTTNTAASASPAPVAAQFASLAPVPAPAPSAAPPSPADIPAPAPVAAEIPAPAYIPAPVSIPDAGPPPAAPPPPPAAPPPPPVVVPAPVPVWVPHPGGLLPHPLNPAGPSHSIGCLPPHHLFGGVCH